MQFKFLTGDINWQDYGGKFVSRKLSNGEFDYWLVLEVINWIEAVGEREAKDTDSKYHVSLSAVSPSEAKDKLENAFKCCGLDGDKNVELRKNIMVQVECLSDYGVSAPLWRQDGNNLKKLLREAHKQAICANGLFGFYMDSPKNRIGSTGWDFIKGDITAGLKRMG